MLRSVLPGTMHLLRWIASRIRGRRIQTFGGGSYWRALHHPDGPYWPKAARALDGSG